MFENSSPKNEAASQENEDIDVLDFNYGVNDLPLTLVLSWYEHNYTLSGLL